MQFRDLRKQYSVLKDRIDAAVSDVLSSGAFIGGEPVRELEVRLAGYVGVRHAITCANGTDALSIALKVWGVGPGDAVFVPDFTFFSTAETVASEGAMPVFVDVRPDTFNIDPVDLRRKIEAVSAQGDLRPRVVVAVDLFGLPADYDVLLPLAREYGLLVLEDGAQGFGGTITSGGTPRRACSFGDIATTSFFPAKPLGCYGDGGAIFTDNDEWAALASSLKVHGKGSCKYDNVRIGMNSRLDTVQAAVLGVKLDAFTGYELEAVQRVALRYADLLAPGEHGNACCNPGVAADANVLPGFVSGALTVPTVPEGYSSSWAQYTICLRDRRTRDALREHLAARGIPSNIYYPAGMHAQTAFAGLPSWGPCPVSESLCGRVLSLPMHPYLTDDEIVLVASEVLAFVN